MAFATVSDPLLAAALWTASGALLATAGLLASTLLIRVRLLRRLEHERRLALLWNPLLAQCTHGVPDALPALAPRDAEPFLVLWCRAQELLRGEAQDHLRELARRLRIEPLASRLLRSRHVDRQLLAMVTLGHLRSRALIATLETLIPTAPPVVSLTGARALLRIDAALGIRILLEQTARREDWPLASVGSIVRECDAQLVGPLLSAAIRARLAGGAAHGLARLLRLHVAAHGEGLRDAVLEVLAKPAEAEVLAAALAALWHPQDALHARRLLEHPEWFVRVAAVRALGRFGDQQDVTRLTAALADASWWVRYRAAQTLCTLSGMTGAELVALAARLTDRYAADMLRQAIAERRPA